MLNPKKIYILKGWKYKVFWKIKRVCLRKSLLNFQGRLTQICSTEFESEDKKERNGLIIGADLLFNN